MTNSIHDNKADAPGNGFRLEIQGLRAIAVMLVLIYHIWPNWMPGGYVGVDVFFVISGYLITGLLVRELERDGRISLSRFYARRIKRLLPAASATLVGVAVASFVLMPEMHWQDTAKEIVASALYYENWWLGYQSVDYLGADASASPVRHFWSLSVEEQYYIAWPWLLVLLGMALAGKRQLLRKSLLCFVAAIGVISLAYSVWLTKHYPAFAYFATTARAWELAMGGVLALVMQRWTPGETLRNWAGFAGMAMVLAAALLFTKETPFPGYAALLPTVGAALIILSGSSSRRISIYSLLRTRVSQFLGSLSYSLYLWHWPVVIFYGYLHDQKPSLGIGMGLIGLALVLAYLSKVIIEDPIHKAPLPPGKMWKPYALGSACILLCGFAAAGQYGTVELQELSARSAGVRRDGAAVMMEGYRDSFEPSLAKAREDNPDVYRKGCHGGFETVNPAPCEFGASDASTVVALVGDSHAAQWLPALQALAGPMRLKIYTFTKSACPFTSTPVLRDRKSGQGYVECGQYNRKVLERLLALKPALVVSSASSEMAIKPAAGADGPVLVAQGVVDYWKQLHAQGIGILAIRDTPRPGRGKINPPECLSKPKNRIADCSVPRAAAEKPAAKDPISIAAAELDGATYMDLSDQICSVAACDPVVGGVLVWRDSHHLTATYARTLAPAVRPYLISALQR